MFDGEVDLNRDFGIEHFLAQGTPVQMVRVNVHQMLLQFVRLGEELEAALAAVLGRRRQEVRAHVGVEAVLRREGTLAFVAFERELGMRWRLLLLVWLLLRG